MYIVCMCVSMHSLNMTVRSYLYVTNATCTRDCISDYNKFSKNVLIFEVLYKFLYIKEADNVFQLAHNDSISLSYIHRMNSMKYVELQPPNHSPQPLYGVQEPCIQPPMVLPLLPTAMKNVMHIYKYLKTCFDLPALMCVLPIYQLYFTINHITFIVLHIIINDNTQ